MLIDLSQVLLVEALGGGDGARCPVEHDARQQVVQGELPAKADQKATLSARCTQELPFSGCVPGAVPTWHPSSGLTARSVILLLPLPQAGLAQGHQLP